MVSDTLVNFTRWNRKLLRNPTSFLLEIVVAVFSLLLFSAVFGEVGAFALQQAGYVGIDYITFLLPAVLMQATMGSSFNSGIGLVKDLDSGMFEKTVVTPMSATAVFSGKAVSELLRIVVQLVIILGLATVLGASIDLGISGALGIIAVCLLVGLLFMSIANIVGLLARDEEALNAASMLFMFPLLFLSPAFIPLSSDIELLATFNPVTYGVDAIRALIVGEDVMTVLTVTRFGGLLNTLVPAVGILLAMNFVFGSLAVWLLGRASSTEGQ
nr:ABC transporter permease [Halovenus rubra]